MTISQIVADLPVGNMEEYVGLAFAGGMQTQFDFARDLALKHGFGDTDNADRNMDIYDAFEIALDDRAIAMGIF